MKAIVRKATLDDLEILIKFTAEEAKEAESILKVPSTLKKGIKAALEDNSKSIRAYEKVGFKQSDYEVMITKNQ